MACTGCKQARRPCHGCGGHAKPKPATRPAGPWPWQRTTQKARTRTKR